jgi:hypothetical protein
MGLLAVALIGVAAAGCGNAGGGRLTKSEFLKRGNAICAKGTRKIDRKGLTFFKTPGHPTANETIAFAKKLAVPTAQAELDQLRALKPPKSDETTVKTILDKTQAAVDRVRSNPGLLGRANGSDEANALARAYGLTACAG